MKTIIMGTLLLGSIVFGQAEREEIEFGFQKRSSFEGKSRLRDDTRGGYSEKLDSVLYKAPEDSTYSSRYTFTHDSLGNISTEITSNRVNGELVENKKVEYIYSNLGDITSEITYKWSDDSWLEETKKGYGYNDDYGDDSSIVYYSWKDDLWVESSLINRGYDSLGNVISFSGYSNSDGYWFRSWKQILSYDSLGYMTSQITTFNSSYDSTKIKYTYDDNGNMLSEIETGTYGDFNYGYRYDDFGNKVSKIDYRLYGTDWVESYKEEYKYDSSVIFSSVPSSVWWIAGKNNPLSIDYCSWDKETEEWKIYSTSTYHYSSLDETAILQKSGKISNKKITLSVSNSKLNISTNLPTGSTLSLFDLSGRKLTEQSVKGSSIALPTLAKGLYIARINLGKSIVLQKIRVR
jgi:hypothetical protein